MPEVLTFVDEYLARQVATGLIGSEVKITERKGSRAGINFKVILTEDRASETSKTTKLADLLPEVVADAIYDSISERVTDLSGSRANFVAGGPTGYRPGTPVLIAGGQIATDNGAVGVLSGEECARYRLLLGEYYVQIFAPLSSRSLFDALVGQPVQVAGVVRFTPPYSVPGAISLNLAVRACAVWLR